MATIATASAKPRQSRSKRTATDPITNGMQQPTPGTLQLPDLDAPALNPSQPAASYKLAFGDTRCWHVSRDAGLSKEATGSAAVAGAVVDLTLQISAAQQRSGEDFRLRLAFWSTDHELAELNLNAVSPAADGSLHITSPARSLAGALLTISDADEDMRAFCGGARFSIRQGRGRGVFVETDIALDGRWLAMSGAYATLRSATHPEAFSDQLIDIKARFRNAGLLLPGPAVLRSSTPTAQGESNG
ncbi:hypothetical protein [Cyanobium sp. NS01]|uniref:hypothetical protein n=1 Tax=Cyanobium sp. NS01 TaxID=261284 RepID=UPI001644C13D|nr:hypothetical protein [Cyanobium sp. NS01]QNI71987.1 hypothetical protein CyaNS01_02893 [Cyanobium sp. NS01]